MANYGSIGAKKIEEGITLPYAANESENAHLISSRISSDASIKGIRYINDEDEDDEHQEQSWSFERYSLKKLMCNFVKFGRFYVGFVFRLRIFFVYSKRSQFVVFCQNVER